MKTRMRVALFLSFVAGSSLLSTAGRAVTQGSPGLDETTRYSVLLGSQRRGAMTVTRDGAALTTHFEFGYGGNGVSLDERIALDDNAVPRSIDISGHHFRGSPARDRFIAENGVATWDSSIAVDGAFSPATIREGFEDAVPELRRAQSDDDEQWQADLAHRLARPLTRPLAIRHARLFAAEIATVKPDTTVVVDNGRIASVGPDQTVAIPPGAESIDASGRMLLPGLWDMHQHVSGVVGVWTSLPV
jgi:hypothetical protein